MNVAKQRILVVDDEPKITRLVRLTLEQTGQYEVREENRARHAVAAAQEFLPDLILLDVMMPGEDGGQLASEFQDSHRLRSIPIIFLTGAVTRQEVSSHSGCIGGHHFLAKPVDIPELIAGIRLQLEKHASQPAAETVLPHA